MEEREEKSFRWRGSYRHATPTVFEGAAVGMYFNWRTEIRARDGCGPEATRGEDEYLIFEISDLRMVVLDGVGNR
jgi:hypothetical protein